MLMDELSHKNEYIEKLEAELRRLSTKLDQEQLKHEKMTSQRTAAGNIKAAEVVEESADSDFGYLYDVEVSTCSESTSIDIMEATKSNSDDISETDENQESCESGGASRDQAKSELIVQRDEAASDSLNIVVASSQSSPHASSDDNDGDDVCMEVIPFLSSKRDYAPSDDDPSRNFFNQTNQFAAPLIVVKNLNVTIPNVSTTRISRSKLSRSKITQEQKSTSEVSKKASSSHGPNLASNYDDETPSNQENRYKSVRKPTKPVQRRQRASINEEDSDSGDSLKSNDSNSDHSGSEERNQEADKSGNQVNNIMTRKNETLLRQCQNHSSQQNVLRSKKCRTQGRFNSVQKQLMN